MRRCVSCNPIRDWLPAEGEEPSWLPYTSVLSGLLSGAPPGPWCLFCSPNYRLNLHRALRNGQVAWVLAKLMIEFAGGVLTDMRSVLPYRGIYPEIHETVFLADGSRVIGDVKIGANSSVWFNAVVRGDVCPIRIGERTNVQDNVTLHVTHDTGPLGIGSNVTIGHGAVLHACTVQDNVLIGMGAILLDGCIVESWSVVAAGSVVRQGCHVPSGRMVAGVPAKVMRDITDAERAIITESPENYLRYAANHLKT
jgi:gamma-carbonic anhydrase